MMPRLIKKTSVLILIVLTMFITVLSNLSPAQAQELTPEPSAAGGFNSQFNGSMAGWATMGRVQMDVNSKYLYATGLEGSWSQAYYEASKFTNFTYSVYMKRLYDQQSPNCIFINMGTGIRQKQNYWFPGYAFCYRNYGWYGIFKRTSVTAVVPIQDWTKTSAVDIMWWNKLKVIKNGSTFKYYINDKLLKTFSDTFRSSGYVGIGMYDNGVHGDQLRVDWATLSTTY